MNEQVALRDEEAQFMCSVLEKPQCGSYVNRQERLSIIQLTPHRITDGVQGGRHIYHGGERGRVARRRGATRTGAGARGARKNGQGRD